MWSVMVECGSSIKTKKTRSTALVLLNFIQPLLILMTQGTVEAYSSMCITRIYVDRQ